MASTMERSMTLVFWYLTVVLSATVSFAVIAQANEIIPPNLQGYYKLEGTSEEQCHSDGWTKTHPTQMRVTDRQVLFFQGSVSCELQSFKPTTKQSWPRIGPTAYDLTLQCHDEGSVGRHRQTWNFITGAAMTAVVIAQDNMVPELWTKCRM